ncbi:MAG: hypothetical protein ED554_09415 [Synechococcus sp. YX04-3]|nr:MAG: hypothetical protein ED554_09415 [Synechococcus sp. YX04-3]
MKMDRIAASSVSACLFNKESFIIKIGTIQWSKFVSAAKVIECSIGHTNISRVHEHHMTATVNGFVLRGEFHVARQIGHMDLQVVTRREVVLK